MAHAHSSGKVGAAVAAVTAWDCGALMLNFNAGAIAGGITAVGGAVIGLVYVGIIKWADVQAYVYKKNLEAHGSEIEQEQVRIKKLLDEADAERQANTAKIADLTRRLDERDRTIIQVQGVNEVYLLELLEAMRSREPDTGFIMESTTKIMLPPSDDQVPAVPAPRDDP